MRRWLPAVLIAIGICFAALLAGVPAAGEKPGVAQDAAKRPSFPFKIYILLYKGADEEIAENLVPELERAFTFPVEVLEERPALPADAWNEDRKQYSAPDVLEHALGFAPADSTRLVAIFPGDIYLGARPCVFGLADPDGRGAVVAQKRLEHGNRKRYFSRMLTVSLHELGHTFGLVHCAYPKQCAMGMVTNLSDLDAQQEKFCPTCRAKLNKAIEAEKKRLLGEEEEQ